MQAYTSTKFSAFQQTVGDANFTTKLLSDIKTIIKADFSAY
jgi:hypothetical protein